MSKLTEEQLRAVNESGTNIIVSAGAGSGKTTVLKSRVLRILESGIGINNLIILTFTNNAASEMKERIRKIISESKDEDVLAQAELLDSAYITTFDSFAQSLVKKYNYLLNISKNFTIVSSSIINIELDKIIDNIFEEKYEERDELFCSLIERFETKNDNNIRKTIRKYYKYLGNLIDRNSFLDTYLDTYYSDNYINKIFDEFEEYVFKLRDEYLVLLELLRDETINENDLAKNDNLYELLESATNFDDLIDIDLSIARKTKGHYTEDANHIIDDLKSIREDLKDLLIEDKKMLINHYLSTKNDCICIIDILREIDKRMIKFKNDHNSYEFSDIALKAIELVRDNEEVRNEIKYNTYEIMIDEYQDTNDIQEAFISYISNNNVYMVGDVKQSIYRFRNANPNIFKNKYDNYANNDNGIKIDLNKNFRSRNEVVDNINLIFDLIMSDDIGGANYKLQHEMVFGNKEYLNHINNDNYNMEILSYENNNYKSDVVEGFIIAKDILNRINNHEKVIYESNGTTLSRDIDYKDFCILIDKSKNFELLKKILEYHNIPTMLYKDISIKDEDEIYILKNLITLIIKVKSKCYDNEFKHCFMSIGRSYVYKMSDDELFDIVSNNKFKDTELYNKIEAISKYVDSMSNVDLLNKVIDEFDIVNKLILVGNVEERLVKLEYFVNNSKDLNNFGMNIYDLNDYFNEILNGDEDIKMSISKDTSSNSVKIMTVHASKGLEYSYVYLPYLYSNFKQTNDNSRFKFSKDYGFIVPFYLDGIGNTIVHTLYKNDEQVNELSERIRLFYVAVTRAKEKLILINSFNDKIGTDMSYEKLLHVNSYSDILTLIKNNISKYVKPINIDNLDISDAYNVVKSTNYKSAINNNTTKLDVNDLKIDSSILDNKHFSKALLKIIDKELKSKLDFGTYMHYVFEVYDFKNDNLNDLDIDDIYKEKIINFLKHDEVKNIRNAITYKEHEISFKKDNNKYHGFIDLLVEYNDYFDIIDYKLSNIDSLEYKNQLNGYKDYIENNYHKPCNIYLYSINKDVFKKLN
jgi:ATP-dependent helicase/nuclease subunit A